MSGPADWSDQAQSDCPSDQVRAKVVFCKTLTTLLLNQWLLNHQYSVLAPYGSPPMANRWPHWGGGSYPSAEVQSAYFTASADRAVHHWWITNYLYSIQGKSNQFPEALCPPTFGLWVIFTIKECTSNIFSLRLFRYFYFIKTVSVFLSLIII